MTDDERISSIVKEIGCSKCCCLLLLNSLRLRVLFETRMEQVGTAELLFLSGELA